jgi:hypothetical protein
VVTARVKTDFDLTNTELTAVSLDPKMQLAQLIPSGTLEYNDPTLSISVAQTLPFGTFRQSSGYFRCAQPFRAALWLFENPTCPLPTLR